MTSQRLILDNLRSCHNVGSIIRTADCLGYSRIVYIGTTPYPRLEEETRLPHLVTRQTAQIAKTALGAELTMPGVYYSSVKEYLDSLSSEILICIEQTEDSIDLADYDNRATDFDIIIGNEVTGVSQELRDAADVKLEIKMLGSKESLNASIAAGVVMYELQKTKHKH